MVGSFPRWYMMIALIATGMSGAVFSAESEVFATRCVELSAPTPPDTEWSNYFSVGFVRAKRAEGTISAIGSNSITDSGTDWSSADFSTEPHYVILTSPGSNEGLTSNIVAHSGTVLNVVG